MKTWLIVLPLLGLLIVGPPLFLGTSTYPITIIDGSSMRPTYSDGDLVIYGAPVINDIQNETIIVYVPKGTGLTFADSILAPAVIHRVVEIIVDTNGVTNFRTKGDNNQFADGQLVSADRVLGVAQFNIPLLGHLLLFIRSTQGLIASGIIILFLSFRRYFLSDSGRRMEMSMDAITEARLEGVLDADRYEFLKIAAEQGAANKNDSISIAFIEFLDGKGSARVSAKKAFCGICGRESLLLISSDGMEFSYCKNCDHHTS